MNCANHPETPVVSYCQFCGKPLCAQCIHKVNNIVSCEPCLAVRVQAATAGYASPFPPDGWQPHPWGTNPWAAFWLSWIPGVGAMYNGQFVKGLAHVVIFALLIDLAHFNSLIGLLAAGWIFYQVFDAYQTAIARRDGLPLPNPLGLNNIGQWFGVRNHGPYSGAEPSSANMNPENTSPVAPNPAATVPSPEVVETAPASGLASEYATQRSMPPAPPNPYDRHERHDFWHSNGRGVPTGAVILIALGVIFLLNNLGVISGYWIDRGWPILLIGLGVWIVIRHNQTPPSGGVR